MDKPEHVAEMSAALRAAWNEAHERHRISSQARPDGELVRQVSRAIHEHLSRRDIMQYLDNDEDCEGLARAVLASLSAPTGERAQIVAWIRRHPSAPPAWMDVIANGVERGDHLASLTPSKEGE